MSRLPITCICLLLALQLGCNENSRSDQNSGGGSAPPATGETSNASDGEESSKQPGSSSTEDEQTTATQEPATDSRQEQNSGQPQGSVPAPRVGQVTPAPEPKPEQSASLTVPPAPAPTTPRTSDTSVVAPIPPQNPEQQGQRPDLLPVPPVPPRPQARARTLQTPDTPLGMSFFRYVDNPTTNIEQIEELAAEVVSEVYNEDDLIGPKLWELQRLVRDRYVAGLYDELASEKVRVLESGLAQAARRKELYGIGGDAAIILTSVLAISVLRGYDVRPKPLQAIRSAGSSVRNTVYSLRESASETGGAIREAFRGRGRTARATGEGVERWFSRVFRKLTPQEKFERNLARIGLQPMEREMIRNNLVPMERIDLGTVSSFRFDKTNISGFDMVPRRENYGEETIEYLVFRQRVGGKIRGEYMYFQTHPLPPEEFNEIYSKVFYGRDKRRFVEVQEVYLGKKDQSGMAGRVKAGVYDASERAREGVKGFVARATENFDTRRAAEAMTTSGFLIGGGYLLGLPRDWKQPEVYLEALIERPTGTTIPEEGNVSSPQRPPNGGSLNSAPTTPAPQQMERVAPPMR